MSEVPIEESPEKDQVFYLNTDGKPERDPAD